MEYRGKHLPGYANECENCNKLKKHKEYLESKRKFIVGEKITNLEELLKCEWVIWHGKTTHIEVIKSLQLRIVMKSLECGLIHKAIKKESED